MSTDCRVDMHVHSTASAHSRLGIQRSLSLPECATDPEEVYAQAKARGMDFVTITDHDTIDGARAIADRRDVFVSEELTAWFRGEPQAVHVLCYGIDEGHHEWLQAHSGDVETCAAYLREHELTAALAHPFFAVAAPLAPRHRRRLAELFPIWETRNGSRAKELNLPAFVYIETHGGIAIAGSDDHAGIDIGATFTQTPAAAGPREFLAHVRAGRAEAHGAQGSAAKWTHAALALAARSLGRGEGRARPEPGAVLAIVERVMREGNLRHGQAAGDLGPEDARALLRAWMASMDLGVDERELPALLRDGRLSHPDLCRRARHIHERRLGRAVQDAVTAAGRGELALGTVRDELFDACIPAIPYAAAGAFLAREKLKLTRTDADRPRVALVTDGLGAVHGVAAAIAQVRERGVPGWEVEVVGTDADVDRRLSAVAEVDLPLYAGLRIGVPTLPGLVETLSEGRYDLIHVTAPGPCGIAAWMLARLLELPLAGSYHTELAAYAGLRSGLSWLEGVGRALLGGFYGACDAVLSPSAASDRRLGEMGVGPGRIARWGRGVDLGRFDPALRDPGAFPGQLKVLYAGRIATEKGIELLADAFLAARARDERLHLLIAGGGPEEKRLRERLGRHATFLGWLEGEALARAYASADLFLFASRTDTFGQVILEAQASGLPVVAVGEGGPASLVADGRTGLLAPASEEGLAQRVLELARKPALRARLGRAARRSVREHTWEGSLAQLAAGYRQALRHGAAASDRARGVA